MALKDLTPEGIFIKILFDGFDFVTSEVGHRIIPPNKINSIVNTTYVSKLFDNVDGFIDYCVNNFRHSTLDGYIPNELMEKYKVGLYTLKQSNDDNNPWNNRRYVLFNSKLLEQAYNKCKLVTPDIQFWVCPSFNEFGKCDGIGFRLLDTEQLQNAFKWLFMSGNNIIYGANSYEPNETCYIVEGFRDYIALKESGYNVLGLGSVTLSQHQKGFLDNIKEPVLLLDNDGFGLKQTLYYNDKYKTAILTGTKHKDAYDTYINGEEIKITRLH